MDFGKIRGFCVHDVISMKNLGIFHTSPHMCQVIWKYNGKPTMAVNGKVEEHRGGASGHDIN
jgi:hypothetical protein